MGTEARIRKLPPQVAERIAAGEVVERPASVVKELIENALDAGATVVDVEIRDGGMSLIRVADNGVGIAAEDVPLVFERFATSKVHTVEDLHAIRTFGFRGEALAAIAAVAEVELLTRTAQAVQGTRALSSPDDPQVRVRPAASPVGTQVIVRRLFARLPARRKFLKSPLREGELVHQTVVRYALAFPEVAFRLTVNKRQVLNLPPAPAPQRIGQVLGRDVADHLVEIHWEAGDLRVHGWISSPHVSKPNRQAQFFTVNRRPIRSGLLAVILERPYAGRIPAGRKPVAVVDIRIDPRFVDVNVHPRKAEVRFAQERSVYWALGRAVEQALESFPRQEGEGVPSLFVAFQEGESGVAEAPTPYTAHAPRALAQLHNTYILAQDEYGLILVDQHAAHEQILFEHVLAHASTPRELQSPLVLHLTPRDADALGDLLPALRDIGVWVEPFGAHAFLVRALPAPLAEAEGQRRAEDVQALIDALLEEAHIYARLAPDALRERLAAKVACVSAIKAGDILDPEEQQRLIDALWQTWSPATCPHGRPAFISITLEEVERRFQRR